MVRTVQVTFEKWLFSLNLYMIIEFYKFLLASVCVNQEVNLTQEKCDFYPLKTDWTKFDLRQTKNRLNWGSKQAKNIRLNGQKKTQPLYQINNFTKKS
jgi:hypothetical protein